MVGKTLGQYQIVEQIGKGGMATVYKAYQPSLNRYVALKILPLEHANSPGFKERFLREAQTVARLNHPHILPIHDAGVESGYSYFAMKFVTGNSIQEEIRDEIPLDDACHIVSQIADALTHAHEQGVIHRDIKPANILLEKGWVYLADFGIAKIMETSIVLTSSEQLIGTPAYMSPEQGQGKDLTYATDIYSLGIVLYEMVTGKLPFTGETPLGVIYKHINEPLPLPRTTKPDLPKNIELIILKAMAKDPSDRYKSGGEMADALRTAVASMPNYQSNEGTTILYPGRPGQTPQGQDPGVQEPTSIMESTPEIFKKSPVKAVLCALLCVALTLVAYLTLKKEIPVPPQTGSLRISSTPAGAMVFMNGNNKGTAPLSISGLQPGKALLRLELEGYEDSVQDFEIKSGQDVHASITLVKKSASVSLASSTYANSQSEVHSPGDTWKEPVTGMDFVWVPGGCYQMGCGSWTSDCLDDEKPVHEVCVDAFWMGKFEVTQQQWEQVMGNNPSQFKKTPTNPVDTVSWDDAKEFIKRISERIEVKYELRLPTEAEWEYACRSGGREEKYSGGNDLNRVAWYHGNSGNEPHEVGIKAANGLGIFDMSGNLWEWCEDIHNTEAYGKHDRNNPTNIRGSSARVIRGGGWDDEPKEVRCGTRDDDGPISRSNSIGFRVVRTAR